MKIISRKLQDTDKIGQIIGENLIGGTVICLEGDLGAGKTTLTQSIAKALNINDYVTSPTFTIIKEYNGRLKLYHMDAYRLESEDDMYDLGYDEYIYSNGVCIIEWASNIFNLIPKHAITITINIDYEKDIREFDIVGEGLQFETLKKGLENYENTWNRIC
ncbi:tRNA (adenosine(37)-N6)-threonylcarbamoyltransferase complex ATPase subunit type 1 TsaE [Sedimentibacter sp. zth1]|uniref:tRNA (adenosine(37)-N6)-threonylcarbamoyltransferase complex ATPase subunit type 1 TsaE n=1 Tax=Sedimentibacter sp. zth1 TaxID=2816908 RepID=UPI001A92BB3E|nr:tRNA (adenosine(37)-N6)-threonylcarbamoyltransferase complex ATPase subunit type 1 TsaE [Sedimentibacter sp. zth1]QSX07013.1 tRNA (adenosine(37)-N6)-threonylcarbamoyltransferase complex ATPase subunit type 1 TsaE [Sedimentibacter sp. zth1]